MPQQYEMKRQKGSVLAGILVLSLVMTMAAGGYIVTAGFLLTNEEDAFEIRDLQACGESVAQLAVRYMRDVPVDNLYGPSSMANGVIVGITPGYPGWTQLQNTSTSAALGNPTFKADYTKSNSRVHVRTWTTFPSGSDTLFISWRLDTAVTGGPYSMSILTLKNWKDSLIAYRPN